MAFLDFPGYPEGQWITAAYGAESEYVDGQRLEATGDKAAEVGLPFRVLLGSKVLVVQPVEIDDMGTGPRVLEHSGQAQNSYGGVLLDQTDGLVFGHGAILEISHRGWTDEANAHSAVLLLLEDARSDSS